MKAPIVKWVVGSALIAAILTGAYFIIQAHQAAMAGSTNGQPSGFYSH